MRRNSPNEYAWHFDLLLLLPLFLLLLLLLLLDFLSGNPPPAVNNKLVLAINGKCARYEREREDQQTARETDGKQNR